MRVVVEHPAAERRELPRDRVDVRDAQRQVGESPGVHRPRLPVADGARRRIVQQLEAQSVSFEIDGLQPRTGEPEQGVALLARDLEPA